MLHVELTFRREDRFWSPDHGSIRFSASHGGNEVRFFLPLACLMALAQPSGLLGGGDYIQLFDAHFEEAFDAAQIVFARDGGISSAYVITDAALAAVGQISATAVIQDIAA